MPYIPSQKRPWIDEHVSFLADNLESPGELNYAITRLLVRYLHGLGLSYTDASAALGVVSDVRDEFYRRVVAPYEDAKRYENGDVYDELTKEIS